MWYIFWIILTIISIYLIKVFIEITCDYITLKELRKFSNLINEIKNIEYSNLSFYDKSLIVRALNYGRFLENHMYYNTIFEFISYRDSNKRIRDILKDILPSEKVKNRSNLIDDILK